MQFHSPSLFISITSNPHSFNLFVTISTLSWIIPDVMNNPPSLSAFLTSSVNTHIISAIIFATTTSAFPFTTSNKLPSKTSILSKLLKLIFSFEESTATGSKSTPITCFAPSFAAAIARIPDPHPTSITVVSGLTYLS